MSDQWINTHEAAALLGVTRHQVVNLINAGLLQGFKANPRAWLVSKESVERLAAERQAKQTRLQR